jgi:membrane protein
MFNSVRSRLIPYLRTQVLPSKPAQLLIQTWLKWDRDNVPGMAAALSYYALFSLFPLLLVVLSVIGVLVGPNTEAFVAVQGTVVRYLPPEVHDLIRDTLIALNENSVGAAWWASAFCCLRPAPSLSCSSDRSTKFGNLPASASEAGSPVKMVIFFITNKLSAFLLVLGTALFCWHRWFPTLSFRLC